MLTRVFLIIACILLCYNFPSVYSNEYAQLANLRENCLRSLLLGVVITAICRERAATLVIIVEFLLCLCNFYVAYNWDTYGGIFNGYYSQVQLGAYILEVIIMLSWAIFGGLGIERDQPNTSISRSILSRSAPHYRGLYS